MERAKGNVVILNGTSSAGKSTIARALQEIMDNPYLHTGVDHFLPRMPARLFTLVEEGAAATSDYFVVVYRDGATRTTAEREGGETVYGEGTLVEVRLGPGALALLSGMYRAVAALAEAGIDVIVDDVIYDRRVLRAAVEALASHQVLFVGLYLPREVAERREHQRGDRGPGGATAFYDLVHAHGVYDLELDSSVSSPIACAAQIKAALSDGRPRTAFRRLAQIFASEQP